MNNRLSQREIFLRNLGQTSESPMMVEIVRAQGSWQYGPKGEKYLDLISGIAVSNVGHCAPEVVKAVQEQAATYMHSMVYGEFVLSPQVKLAEKIVQVLGSRLDNVFLVNSGSEAVEGALKLAKKFTGRTQIVACHHSYHGSTHGALSVTGALDLKAGFGPFLPGITFIHHNSIGDLRAITEETAAFIVEPIQGEAGVRLPDPGYLQAVRQRCDETGTLLIFDEIQSGFGRTGTLFAHQAEGVEPDILLIAKGMGGGMPIGAFISRKEIMHCLTHDPVLGHISTFGGHPVSAAASLATLNKILDENLLAAIPQKEALIRQKLAQSPFTEVRGRGLMFAAELGSFEKVLGTIHTALQNGVISDWFLHCNTAIRIAPPLTITLEELDWGLDQLIKAATIP